MIGWLLTMALVLGYLAHTFFFWKSGRHWFPSEAKKENKAPYVFEDEGQITHAHLAHFPAEIGRWHTLSAAKNHK
jgi:hypothetical protein